MAAYQSLNPNGQFNAVLDNADRPDYHVVNQVFIRTDGWSRLLLELDTTEGRLVRLSVDGGDARNIARLLLEYAAKSEEVK